jgi:type II secretion system protein H
MHATARQRPHGFTLLELIVVMTLLSVMLALAAPRLSGFMSGRDINEECRRLVALTRLARGEAIGRSERMELWIAPDKGEYGLRPESPTLREQEPFPRFRLAAKLGLEVEPPTLNEQGEAAILFWPDGTIDENSPWKLTLTEQKQARRVIALTDNRLEYAVEEPTNARR